MTASASRLWATVRKKAIEVVASELVRGLLLVVAAGVLPFVSSLYAPGWLGRSLTRPIALPPWVLVSCALFVVVLAAIVGLDLRRRQGRAGALRAQVAALTAEIERRDKRAATFPWGGVEWPLSFQNFWGIVESTSADAFVTGGASLGLLDAAIGDPLCANCRREVWPHAGAGRCGECGAAFRLGLERMEAVPLDVRLELKRRVYAEARAEYLRQQMRPASR